MRWWPENSEGDVRILIIISLKQVQSSLQSIRRPKSIYSSGTVAGVMDIRGEPSLFVSSLKKSKIVNHFIPIVANFLLATKYIFDYLLMAYINGLHSFGHRSKLVATTLKSKKGKSTEKWMDALAPKQSVHIYFAGKRPHRPMGEWLREAQERPLQEALSS